MTDNQMFTMYADATQQDRETFVSDWAMSSLFAGEDPAGAVDMALVEQLGRLWDVANVPFDRLLQLLGMNITQCHQRFCIPYRTVQNWSQGERSAPSYIRLMMAEASGWVTIRQIETSNGK